MKKLSCLLVFLLATITAYAAITGVISGIIADPSGAALAGVAVTATNQATGVVATAKTDSKGFYSFPALDVGSYTINVHLTGFKDFSEQNIRIDANSSLKTDIALVLGDVTETEQVNAETLGVETQSTQLGQVIEAEKITSVPLNGRSFTDLLQLQPGVSPYKGTSEGSNLPASGNLNTGNQSVNGGREASNAFMVNGADTNEGVSNGAAVIPNLDSLAEFRIITNNFDAEYGNFSGGQVNVVTKGGTNKIHGTAFEFLRNTDLDAANYYAAGQRGEFKQNIFGGVVGGPIRKDKMFFFGDFQGTKLIQGVTQNYAVPSNADRTGDLTDVANQLTGSVQGTSWANTLTQRLGYQVSAGEPYSGCNSTLNCVFPNGQIPKSAWDTPAAKLMQYIPQDTSGGFFTTSAYSGRLSDYKGAGRFDGTTRFGNVFGYYFIDKFSNNNPYGGGNSPGFPATSTGKAQMANLGLTTTLKNNAVNDFRFAYIRDVNFQNVPTGPSGVTLSSLGFVTPWGPTGGIGAIFPAYENVPNISFNNYPLGVPADTLRQYNNTFQWIDNYTKILGAHTLQFGASYHYDQINERNYYGENGSFGFSGGNETGYDFADFLIGAPSSFIQASNQILDSRSNYVGVYAQDSWRATSSLTLNMGVRYEISTPWYDTQNKLEAIIPGVQSVLFPGAPKGYLVPGDPGVSRTLAPIKYDNVAPRFGFAYTPSAEGFLGKITGGPGKSSVRGGYGIFYTNIQDATGFVEVGDAPYGLFYASPVQSKFSTPFIDRATGNNEGQRFPFQFPPTNVSKSHPDTSFNWASVEPISGSLVYDTKNVLPYVESFYLGFQRELPSQTILTVNYVGNVGRKLLTEEESNPGDAALCQSLTQAALAPGQSACGPYLETNLYTLANGSTVDGTRILGLDFGSNPYMETSASSSYNSLQTSLQHRDKYVDFLAAYTFSRSFDNGSSQHDLTNVLNPALSRGLSNFDVTHNFVVSYTVPIPFDGYMPQHGLVHSLAGGWAVSGITTFASGLPITLSENDDYSLTGTGADLPNYTPGHLIVNKDPRKNKMMPYFNTSLFSTEALGTFGNSPRRFFHGPGLNNTDMALLKTFGITEATKLEFRAEAFNVFNHAQFNAPSGDVNNAGIGGFGYVTSANDPRIMQVALKLLF